MCMKSQNIKIGKKIQNLIEKKIMNEKKMLKVSKIGGETQNIRILSTKTQVHLDYMDGQGENNRKHV